MKKTILYLMNGFGIEQIDSYSIYNRELMPNLDFYTRNYLFAPIETPCFDLMEGFRYFSTGSPLALTYPFLDEFLDKMDTNPNLRAYVEHLTKDNNMHLFAFVENDKSVSQLKQFLNYVRSKTECNIYLHLVLDSKDHNDYKEFDRIITRMNYDMKDYPIYTIVGKNILKNKSKDYVSILNHGIGERWKEISKKFNSLLSGSSIPCDTDPFFVNDKFPFTSNDYIFFYNYNPFDCSNFVRDLNTFNQIKTTFSMFPLVGVNYPMFAYPVSNTSTASSLASIKAKALIISPENSINLINYYANGLRNVLSPNINYMKLDGNILNNANQMQAVINDPQFNLIIINNAIDASRTVDELNNKLREIDNSLKLIHDICDQNKYTFIISSLYGINRELIKDNFSKVRVNFSKKVPVIVKDETYQKDRFIISQGNPYTLANTVYTNMDLSYKGEVLIHKKGFLAKLLKK